MNNVGEILMIQYTFIIQTTKQTYMFAWTCWYKQLSHINRFTSYNLSVTEMNQTSHIDKLKMALAKDCLAKQCIRAKSNYKECQKKMRNKGKAEQR